MSGQTYEKRKFNNKKRTKSHHSPSDWPNYMLLYMNHNGVNHNLWVKTNLNKSEPLKNSTKEKGSNLIAIKRSKLQTENNIYILNLKKKRLIN